MPRAHLREQLLSRRGTGGEDLESLKILYFIRSTKIGPMLFNIITRLFRNARVDLGYDI